MSLCRHGFLLVCDSLGPLGVLEVIRLALGTRVPSAYRLAFVLRFPLQLRLACSSRVPLSHRLAFLTRVPWHYRLACGLRRSSDARLYLPGNLHRARTSSARATVKAPTITTRAASLIDQPSSALAKTPGGGAACLRRGWQALSRQQRPARRRPWTGSPPSRLPPVLLAHAQPVIQPLGRQRLVGIVRRLDS